MNVRLSTELTLLSSIHWLGETRNNLYSIGLGLMSNTENNYHTNIAMARIRCYVNEVLRSGIFIDQKLQEEREHLNAVGFKTIPLPEQPFDQSVAIMLYCKLNAICENNMIITDITVSSVEGDNVRYHFDSEDPFGPFAEDGWWNESDPSWCDHSAENPSGKVLKLDKKLTWHDLGLDWEQPSEEGTGNVVVGDFSKKE